MAELKQHEADGGEVTDMIAIKKEYNHAANSATIFVCSDFSGMIPAEVYDQVRSAVGKSNQINDI